MGPVGPTQTAPPKKKRRGHDAVSIARTFIAYRVLTAWNWLRQEGPHHPKHSQSYHAVFTCLLHYTIVTIVSLVAHDIGLALHQALALQRGDTIECNHDVARRLEPRRRAIAVWFLLYVAFLLLWRLAVAVRARKNASSAIATATGRVAYIVTSAVWYEYCWLCNVTLWLSAVALLTKRPILAQAYAVTVGIDQLLWYVDIASYGLTGVFAVGVAKYLCWPGNTDWTSRITCTHHFWTIPLVLYASGCFGVVDETNASVGRGMHCLACPLSFVCMTINVVVSRGCTPSHIEPPNMEGSIEYQDSMRPTTPSAIPVAPLQSTQHSKYLNVNLSHALWKDIQFAFLQIDYDNPPVFVYLGRLLWRWQGFNTLIFGLLWMACQPLGSETSAVLIC